MCYELHSILQHSSLFLLNPAHTIQYCMLCIPSCSIHFVLYGNIGITFVHVTWKSWVELGQCLWLYYKVNETKAVFIYSCAIFISLLKTLVVQKNCLQQSMLSWRICLDGEEYRSGHIFYLVFSMYQYLCPSSVQRVFTPLPSFTSHSSCASRTKSSGSFLLWRNVQWGRYATLLQLVSFPD